MDPVNPIESNPEVLNQTPIEPDVPNPEVKKSGNSITVAAMALFVLLTLSAVAFLYYQNQQLKSMLALYQNQQLKGMLASYQTPVSSSTPVATTDPTADWKTYQDQKYQYLFKYPESWIDKTDDSSRILGNFTLETNSGEFVTGTVFTGTPDIENDKKNGGSSKSFVLTEQIYLLVTYVECLGPGCDLSKKYLDIFNQVISTFKIAGAQVSNSASTQKACTMEAKLCPDGSSVGRGGPNCEFTPCPTPNY